jgi:hypothetical protein
MQAHLGQGVGQEVGVEVEELLVDRIDDQPDLVLRSCRASAWAISIGAAEIDRHVPVERGRPVAVGARSSSKIDALFTGANELHARCLAASRPAPQPACRSEIGLHPPFALPPAALIVATVSSAAA